MKYVLNEMLFTKVQGKLGNDVIYMYKGILRVVRKRYIDKAGTTEQLDVRDKFNLADDAFLSLTYDQQQAWRHAATARKKGTNYSYFISINMTNLFAGKPILYDPPS